MLWKLLLAFPGAQTGIIAIPAYDISRDPTPDEKVPWFRDFVPGVRLIQEKHYTNSAARLCWYTEIESLIVHIIM